MEREVLWTPWEEPGVEHLRLTLDEQGVNADGLVIGVEEERAFRVSYRVRCDAQWRVREAHVANLDDSGSAIHLHADGLGHWTNGAGDKLNELDGCIDIDIRVTPFTNTLPIRRLALKPGEPAEIAVVYIAAPAMSLMIQRQRYTYLEQRSDGARFLYEGLASGFTAEVGVDADGLVTDYSGVFRRVWSSPK